MKRTNARTLGAVERERERERERGILKTLSSLLGKSRKQNDGITLISLVITIIVLLILARN